MSAQVNRFTSLASCALEAGATDLLRAHQIPVPQARLQALHGTGALGVRLGPFNPERAQGVGVLDVFAEVITGCPFIELKRVDIGYYLLLGQILNRIEHRALFGWAVQLGLGANLDRLHSRANERGCL